MKEAVLREVRLVKQCRLGCGEIRVSIRYEVTYAKGNRLRALRCQHKRIPGQTAIITFTRNAP